MAVVIEELQAEVAPPAAPAATAEPQPAADAPDERKIVAALWHELWRAARLVAD